MEKMPDTGPGRPLKYPYTLGAKLMQFPYRRYWKGRGVRFIAYSVILSLFIVRPIDKFVNSPENVEMWRNIRAKRKHDKFAPPTETSGGH